MDVVGSGGFSSDDVLIEILKRLPVKSLIRFMSISKPWNHLINDPFLVTSHLQFNKQSPSSHLHSHSVLGIPIYGDEKFEHILIEKTHKKQLYNLKIHFPWKRKLKLNPQPQPRKESVGIIGHCNGVVCACDYRSFDVPALKSSTQKPVLNTVTIKRYVICNPITRRFHILPESDFKVPDLVFDKPEDDQFTPRLFRSKTYTEKSGASGFGFIDDVAYKVVIVSCAMAQVGPNHERTYKAYEPPWIEVYDSRVGSWRIVAVDPEFSYDHLYGTGAYNSSDKCLYWFGRGYGKKNRYFTLVWFDLVDEKWEETLLPYKSRSGYFDYEDQDLDNVFGEYGVCYGIDVVRESVVMFVGDQRNKLVHSVWKMNREDDKVSWTHMYRLNYEGGSESGFCRDGELLLYIKEGGKMKLVMHDPKKMNDACFGFTDLDLINVGIYVHDFVESLVLLDGETEVIEDASEEILSRSEEQTTKGFVEEDQELSVNHISAII